MTTYLDFFSERRNVMREYKEISVHSLHELVQKMNELARQKFRCTIWVKNQSGTSVGLTYEAIMERDVPDPPKPDNSIPWHEQQRDFCS